MPSVITRPFQVRLPPGGLLCLALILLTPLNPAVAQEEGAAAESAQPRKLFESSETLALTIRAPWRKLISDAGNEKPYPATMTYTDESGQAQTVDITVERRGLTRQRICAFPPIRLRFDKTQVKGTAFRGQKALKMVTHCDTGDRWEQYYVKELLAYRMYNRVTELSFRVRPLAVQYVEADGGSSRSPRFAFLIEDDSDVAGRNSLEKVDLLDIEPEQLEPQTANRLALFQYMIGNVDWSTLGGPGAELCCHNAKLMGANPTNDLIAVPYDFDSAGLVDAAYAAPNEGLPIVEVTDRLFRGFCVHNQTLESARHEFLALEPEIFALVRAESRLSPRNLKIMSRFLNEFFDTLKSDRAFNKEIIRRCRK
jgi:hypothetical protein